MNRPVFGETSRNYVDSRHTKKGRKRQRSATSGGNNGQDTGRETDRQKRKEREILRGAKMMEENERGRERERIIEKRK